MNYSLRGRRSRLLFPTTRRRGGLLPFRRSALCRSRFVHRRRRTRRRETSFSTTSVTTLRSIRRRINSSRRQRQPRRQNGGARARGKTHLYSNQQPTTQPQRVRFCVYLMMRLNLSLSLSVAQSSLRVIHHQKTRKKEERAHFLRALLKRFNTT